MAAVVALVAAFLGLGPRLPARASVEGHQRGLRLVADEVLSDDGRLHELTLHSAALGRDTRVRVLLPAGYDDPAAAQERYPVLLLLHGASGDQSDWTDATDVEGLTEDLDLVVVMPDGGAQGFYTDWLDGPQWETHHLGELVPWIDATYRTVGTREGRAVAGLSMGGFGAMAYAARHPDLFATAASFSGGVDIADLSVAEAAALELIGLADDRKWGPFLTHEARWRGHNPPDLATNLRWTRLHLTSGSGLPCPGDRPEAGVIEAATWTMTGGFAARLELAGVPYEAELRLCGTHEWHWWERDLARWLPGLMASFASPLPRPEAFDHRTSDHVTQVWGWTFTATRPAIELLDLRAVSPRGLTATGSGAVDVVTPPVYEPGAVYRLTGRGAGTLTVPLALVPPLGTGPQGDPSATTVVADPAGRLRFRIDLGPGHVPNQYAPGGLLGEVLQAGRWFRTVQVTIEPAPAP